MSRLKPAAKADITKQADRGESTGRFEPLRLSEDSRRRAALTDLALELAQRSAGFRRSLSGSIAASLADLVRAMNCYYSNLIEGHDTHPVEIERALKNDYSSDPKKRLLQLEAKAHIKVQEWLDEGGLQEPPVTVDSLREIHRRFYEHVPEEVRRIENPVSGERLLVIPGELRRHDVQVGNHFAVSPGAVPRFLARFEAAFTGIGKTETVLTSAAAHHRLTWIHPFLDGNGRVARLMSHATFLQTLDTGGVWSVARGLARSVQAYKAHLANCDMLRRNDLDGRGTLSEEALVAFTEYFLRTCLDQVAFMEALVQPERLRARILLWAEEEIRLGLLPAKAGIILDALVLRGELPRGEISHLLQVSERQSRRVVAALGKTGVVVSKSSRAPIRLSFPAALAGRFMPGLFPEKDGDG